MSIVLAKSHGWVHAPKGLGRHLSTRLHATNLALGGIRPARRHRTLTCARHSRRPRRPLPRPTTKQGIVVQFLRADPRPHGGDLPEEIAQRFPASSLAWAKIGRANV